MSTSQQISQNLVTNINLDGETESEEDLDLSESNKNIIGKPEILISTIQYITNNTVSDDEEIDVVTIDEYPKSLNNVVLDATIKKSKIKYKPCSTENSPVSKTKNTTIKPVLTVAEGMQTLFSSINNQSTNSSRKDKITNDVAKLKAIENVLDDRVKNDKNLNDLDDVYKQKSYFKTFTTVLNNKLNNRTLICKQSESVINVKNNNSDLDISNNTLVKSINDEKFAMLYTVKVILDRNVVDNYFKSKQLISEKGISNSNQTNKVSNNNLRLNVAEEINNSRKPNNKTVLKQSTILQFFNMKSIKESKYLHTTTTVIEKNKNPSARINEILNLNTSKSTKKQTFLYCNDCDYKTDRGKARIIQHIQTKHTDGFINGIANCQQCGKSFKQATLKLHQATCGLMPHFMCPFCSLRSKYASNIKKHILRQHKSEFKPNELDDIFHKIVSKGKAFKAKVLKLAIEGKEIPKAKQEEKNTMKNKIDLYCTGCNQFFVRDHKKKNNKTKKCPNCDKLLHCYCVKCSKVFNSYTSCWSHITSACELQGLEILRCNDCSFTSFTKTKLIRHIQRRHTEIDPKDYVKCPNCDKGFKNRAYMLYHQKTCGKSKDYQCQFCSYKTKYIYQWKKHIQKHALHSKDKNITLMVNTSNLKRNASCETNNSSTIAESSEHKLKIPNNNKYKIVQVLAPNTIKEESLQEKTLNTLNLATYICLNCNAIDTSTRVKVIDCNKCQVPMRYSCKSCKRTYSNWGNFCCHLIQKCATPHNYQCDHCDRQFTIKDNIRRHIFAEHIDMVDANGYVKCPKCKNKYKGRQNMLKHKLRCGKAQLHFKCKFCNQMLNYKYNLRKHMLRHHTNLSHMEVEDALNETAGKAKEKNKETKNNKIPRSKSNTLTEERKNNLRLVPTNKNGFHIISLKMNKKEKMDTQHLILIKCPSCLKSYTIDKKKKDHKLSSCFYCRTNNAFMCIQCSKEYSRVAQVRKHIKREHLLDPAQHLLHECSNCEKRFTFYENLKAHWRLCFKTDKLICDYCGFATKHRFSLVNHIRRVHLGNKIKKNHECAKCSFKFIEKEQLQKHMRSCIGGCECDECGAKFRTKLELINHIQSKKINQLNCYQNSDLS